MTLIEVLLVAALGSGPAAPLTGCTAEPKRAGWGYQCGTLSASIEDFDGAADPAQSLDVVADKLRKGMGVAAEVIRERRRLAGREVESLRMVLGDKSRTTVYFMVPRREGTRMLTCGDEALTRCGPVLDALVQAGWRAGPADGTKVAARRTIRPVLLGKPVTIPAECEPVESDGGMGVGCPRGFMAMWASGVEDMDEGASGFEAWAVEDVLKGRRGARDAVPCHVRQVAARCQRLRVLGSGNGPAVVLTARLEHQGERLLVACIAPGETGDAVPCSLVLGLK